MKRSTFGIASLLLTLAALFIGSAAFAGKPTNSITIGATDWNQTTCTLDVNVTIDAKGPHTIEFIYSTGAHRIYTVNASNTSSISDSYTIATSTTIYDVTVNLYKGKVASGTPQSTDSTGTNVSCAP